MAYFRRPTPQICALGLWLSWNTRLVKVEVAVSRVLGQLATIALLIFLGPCPREMGLFTCGDLKVWLLLLPQLKAHLCSFVVALLGYLSFLHPRSSISLGVSFSSFSSSWVFNVLLLNHFHLEHSRILRLHVQFSLFCLPNHNSSQN